MPKLEKNKRHLREIMLFLFNSKKNAAETHRIITEVYGKTCIGKTTCRDWFRRFRNGDLDVEDKERPGQMKKFEDVDLRTLLYGNPSLTQKELAYSLGVSQATISTRLKALGVIKKQVKTVNAHSSIPKYYIFKGAKPLSKRTNSDEE